MINDSHDDAEPVRPGTVEPLTAIHEDIDRCRRCEPEVNGFRKPPHLDRGEPGKVFVIGEGPGNAELHGSRAFAGQSGRTLDKWLKAARLNEGDPRKGVYLTSVIKCCHSSARDFDLMARNCADFLQRQMMAVRPGLVITLGRNAYLKLRFGHEDYPEALCRPVHTSSFLLFSQFGFHFWLLPWPHPSGLNRWHNKPANKQRLQKSFEFIQRLLEVGLEKT
jgi:uracil-DNA glycosylase family 4